MIFKFKDPMDKRFALPESYVEREKVKIKEVMLPWTCPDCGNRYSFNFAYQDIFREGHKWVCGKEKPPPRS